MRTETKVLYTKDTSGKIRVWETYAEEDKYYTRTYLLNGKETAFTATRCVAKNVTKSNATTAEEQAVLESDAKYNLKLKDDYHTTIEAAQASMVFSKMLAHSLDDYKHKVKLPYFMDPKLDGIACNIYADTNTGKIQGRSRNNNDIPTTFYIRKKLEEFFKVYPTVVLCGELYNHAFKDRFEDLTSLIKRQKLNPQDEDNAINFLQYHVYDIYDSAKPNATISERNEWLTKFSQEYFDGTIIQAVERKLVTTQAAADDFHFKVIENGFEGSMIRTLDNVYQPGKRSSTLLKRKDFIDAEFEILDILEGNGMWLGHAKRAVVRVNNEITSEVGLRGDFAYCKTLLDNKENAVGKMATIQYFGITADGKLRMGTMKGIRDYE